VPGMVLVGKAVIEHISTAHTELQPGSAVRARGLREHDREEGMAQGQGGPP
jgi:hypothetical protein